MSKKKQANNKKHRPQRTCVSCRQTKDKRLLTRLVWSETCLLVDETGKASGRGAYLCNDPDCWERSLSSEVLSKALKETLSGDDRTLLRTYLANLKQSETATNVQ